MAVAVAVAVGFIVYGPWFMAGDGKVAVVVAVAVDKCGSRDVDCGMRLTRMARIRSNFTN